MDTYAKLKEMERRVEALEGVVESLGEWLEALSSPDPTRPTVPAESVIAGNTIDGKSTAAVAKRGKKS